MSDEEGNKGRQSKEERAAMKNAARSQRSIKARGLLANLITSCGKRICFCPHLSCRERRFHMLTSPKYLPPDEQHKIDIEPAKITSTKYVRELGLKFVPSDEQNFPWPYISTSQISSQDLAMLEAAISNSKVAAVKDDMYNAAAAFRSRSSISTPSRPNLSPTHSFSFPPHPHEPHSNPPPDSYRGHPPSLPPLQTTQPPPHSPHSHSRLNSLAEASSAQASATSAHPSSANPGHHWAGATAAVSTSTHISSPPEGAPPTGPVPQSAANEGRSATGFTPSNPRKRMYPFDTVDSHIDEEEMYRIKIPRTSIKHVLEQENANHIARIRDLEARVAELERDFDRQNKDLHRLRNENERLRKDLTLQGGDELEKLRQENEHLKALGRKLFD
ncbi:hypothetical protein TWF696_006055 [Orbilia brochopaga]|uniref:Uncharacterized protein n=1 Tax=Orbilia brochopaga TaxID=3140254 RepID=A0AAV9V1G5_9PEZI